MWKPLPNRLVLKTLRKSSEKKSLSISGRLELLESSSPLCKAYVPKFVRHISSILFKGPHRLEGGAEHFFIRVWKPFLNMLILKSLREIWKGKI